MTRYSAANRVDAIEFRCTGGWFVWAWSERGAWMAPMVMRMQAQLERRTSAGPLLLVQKIALHAYGVPGALTDALCMHSGSVGLDM